MHGIGSAAFQGAVVNRIVECLPQLNTLFTGTQADNLDRARADATSGDVNDPLKGGIVIAVEHQAKVSQGIFDF